MLRVETRIDVLQPEQTLEQQSSSNEQHRGESDFADNQKTPKPISPRAFSRTAHTLFKGLVHVGIRRLKGRDKSKKKAGGQRNNQRKRKDTEIEANVQDTGCVAKVVFTIDGTEVASAEKEPYTATIDPKDFPELADGIDGVARARPAKLDLSRPVASA